MNKSIENTIWYSICGFNHLLNIEKNKIELYNLKSNKFRTKKIIDDKLAKQLSEAISAFGFSNEELESKKSFFDSMTINHTIFNLENYIDSNKYDFISSIHSEKEIQTLFSDLSILIEKKDPKILNDVLYKLSSIQFLELVEKFESFSLFKIYSKVLSLFNKIIDGNSDLFEVVDNLKEPFYFLITNILYQLYIDNQLNDDVIELLKQYEILDLFIIFERNECLLPNGMIKKLLSNLSISVNLDVKNEKSYYCLKMFLLAIVDPLDEQYIVLYKKYFNINVDSAYLKMATFAAYMNNYSKFKTIMKDINSDELDSIELDNYYDLLDVLEKDDKNSLITYKVKDEILELLKGNDYEVVLSYLEKILIDNYITKFTFSEVVKCLLEKQNFNKIEAEFILAMSPRNLINYFSKDSDFVDDNDIASLYSFSVLLIKLNLFRESHLLTTKLLEKVLALNVVNSMVISILELQIKTLELFLRYRY